MNNQERLKSHKRMYLWIEEKTKKNCDLDEDYKRNDWDILTDLYPELLTLVEDLIRDLEKEITRVDIIELRTREIDPDFIGY